MQDIDEASSGPVITDQEREISQNALTEFNKGNYTLCLQQLNRLDSRNQDYKVFHNKAVAEYFKGDLKKTDLFKKNLNLTFNQGKIRAEVIDDVEQCVYQYNLSVLLYHQQQYAASLRIVNRLFSFIEPMDETLAHKVCLLLIELHIVTNQAEKALNLIEYVENQFINPELPVILTGDKEIKILKKESKDKKKLDSTAENLQMKLLQYRARCRLMMHTLKLAKQEIKELTSLKGKVSIVVNLEANFEYLRGNFRNAIEIYKSFPSSELDFKQSGESSAVIFFNNMGIIHHVLGKPNLSCYYLQRAIKENDKNIASLPKPDNNELLSGRPLYTVGGSKTHEIIYNLGVALLYAGRPIHAFDCLVMAVQRYHRNPRLWLRLAECCIQVHKSSNKKDFDPKLQDDIVQCEIGKGLHKKIIFPTNLSNDKVYSSDSQSSAIPVPTLEFASLCLRNALILLSSDTNASTQSGANAKPRNISLTPSIPASEKEIKSLKMSVLVASAYVSLCLGDYVMTYEYSEMLLQQFELPGAYKLLCHLYAAEALVLMNRISDAMEHLNLEKITDVSTVINKNEDEFEERSNFNINNKPPIEWFPDNLETAQIILRYNLAVALTLKGDYEKAAEILKKIWLAKNTNNQIPAHVLMLVLYVELQIGNIDLTRSLIKQHCKKYR